MQQVSNFDETFEKARNRVQQNRIKKVFKPQGVAKETDFFSPKFGDNKFRAKSNLKSSTNKDKKEISFNKVTEYDVEKRSNGGEVLTASPSPDPASKGKKKSPAAKKLNLKLHIANNSDGQHDED